MRSCDANRERALAQDISSPLPLCPAAPPLTDLASLLPPPPVGRRLRRRRAAVASARAAARADAYLLAPFRPFYLPWEPYWGTRHALVGGVVHLVPLRPAGLGCTACSRCRRPCTGGLPFAAARFRTPSAHPGGELGGCCCGGSCPRRRPHPLKGGTSNKITPFGIRLRAPLCNKGSHAEQDAASAALTQSSPTTPPQMPHGQPHPMQRQPRR